MGLTPLSHGNDRAAEALNCRHWNDRALIHARDATGFYRIEECRAGGDTLTPIEAGELGDLSGLSVLHLQCHLGLDTLSLARRGARACGIDFSTVAIAFAQRLAAETGLAAHFVEGDVHDVRALVGGRFNLVFASWGVLCWVADLAPWCRAAAAMLRPGGRLYLADDHPGAATLRQTSGADGGPVYVFVPPWRTWPAEPLALEVSQSYTGDPAPIAHTACRQWLHPFSELFGGLLGAGFRIDFLHEHESVPWRRFAALEPGEAGLWRFPAGVSGPPLAFSLAATLAG
ncbi:MAG: class I SAM-dependent methyltransferase [Acetobacteraceae bacterium]